MVKCIILGCNSNDITDINLKFFKFPTPDNKQYEKWMQICYRSAEFILKEPMPYICSKHFAPERGCVRHLRKNTYPSLYLDNKEATPLAEEKRKTYLINDTVVEWSMRAKQRQDLVPDDKLRIILTTIAEKVRNMLDPALNIKFDEKWWKRIRLAQTFRISDASESSNKCLTLARILKELDPDVMILHQEKSSGFKDWGNELLKLEGNESKCSKKKDANKNIPSRTSSRLDPQKERKPAAVSKYQLLRRESRPKEHKAIVKGFVPDRTGSTLPKIPESHSIPTACAKSNDRSCRTSSSTELTTYNRAIKHLGELEDFILRHENLRAMELFLDLQFHFNKRAKNLENI